MNIADRLRFLLAFKITDHRRFKALEELTSISAEAWRAFENDRQKPSAEMIASVSGLWPAFAFWLATGITDPLRGHVSPPGANTYPTANGGEQEFATAEMLYLLKIQHAVSSDVQESSLPSGLRATINSLTEVGIRKNFEKQMKALDISPDINLLPIECDDGLREIRARRHAKEQAVKAEWWKWNDSLHINSALRRSFIAIAKMSGLAAK